MKTIADIEKWTGTLHIRFISLMHLEN